MNTRSIKLALTVGLINSTDQPDAVPTIISLMSKFEKEVGHFMGFSVKNNKPLNTNHVKQTYAMKFERCTLDVDMISNPITRSQTVQNFQLRA